MLPFESCPDCTGQIIEQEVNHQVKGGGKVVVLKVRAYVCSGCGERLYSLDSVKKFERIKAQLESFG
ncbi:YgiT-type zinc finger protein [Microcoleus sp. herbarium13]|uniref:YgiT-type zinc finger protein n=1 Tax=unclassified Microcoleus TaxID=2642155 RepID=UPI003FA5B6FE